jgi:hypothetical protein
LRHGRADDKWIQLGDKHLTALSEIDAIDGLEVLHHLGSHRTADDMMVTLFYEKARAYAQRDVWRVKDLLDVMDPEVCDECHRRTFVPPGYDDSLERGPMGNGDHPVSGEQRRQRPEGARLAAKCRASARTIGYVRCCSHLAIGPVRRDDEVGLDRGSGPWE